MRAVDTDLRAAARRLQLAFDLYQTGEEMMRQKLRREHPALSPAEIEARVLEWLLDRPGAELGDSSGRPVPWPRGNS
jgi:hypothetical protein